MRLRQPRAQGESSGQDGFTILELVVALGLLAFVMSALAGAFYSAAGVAVSNNLRTQATGVATRALEAFRAVPYGKLGFYADQGAAAECDPENPGADTVIVGPEEDIDGDGDSDARFVPTDTETIPESDTVFTVKRCVVWADAPGTDPLVPDYKRTRVDVSWLDARGVSRSINQQSIVYPGNLNTTATTTPPVSGCVPGQPQSVTATPPADPTQFDRLVVSWSDPSFPEPHHYGVQWDTTGSFAAPLGESPTGDGSTKSLTITGLSGNTTYFVRVFSYCDAAESTPSSPSGNASAKTHPDPSTVCSLGSLSAFTNGTPPSDKKLYVKASGAWGVKFNISVEANANCTSAFQVELRGPTNIAPGDTLRDTVSLTSKPHTPGTFEGFLNAEAAKYPVGQYDLVLVYGGVTQPGSKTFNVCAYPEPATIDWSTSACS